MPPLSSLLDATLCAVARRYALPATPVSSAGTHDPATAIALVIEQIRADTARGGPPDAALGRLFTEALARLIHGAVHPRHGDPVFQAMVLRHRTAPVREYASLSAHAGQDRRAVHAAVNAIAHPAKQQRMPQRPHRAALERLHAAAAVESWTALADIARETLATPEIPQEPPVKPALTKLLDGPALARLMRLDVLSLDENVRRYQALWDRQGPRSGSAAAAASGSASRQRGAAVEAMAAQALGAWARRLGARSGGQFRVVTSLRVPAAIPGNAERAKTEWDAVLLRQAEPAGATPLWDVCLLVEAKASVDAAATDLPRLLRGLRLLAHADGDAVYPFDSQQGTVRLRGASLRALGTAPAELARTVLYCCDAPADASPRLLSAAGRMQLLSAQGSLDFAARLADGQAAQPSELEPVWHQLLEQREWHAVLNQYPLLRQARALMVHTDDLLRAVDAAPRQTP
ncbi:hypothetical protein D3C87_544500 [compost metagenome]